MSSHWHTFQHEALAHELRSNMHAGLSEEEARFRLSQQGFNELPEAPPASPFTLFFAQFSNLIVWVLIGAALLSGLLQEWLDAAAILTIVLLNALLGFVQEYKAERSLAALKRLSVATARVIRGGRFDPSRPENWRPAISCQSKPETTFLPTRVSSMRRACARRKPRSRANPRLSTSPPKPCPTRLWPWPIGGTCSSWAPMSSPAKAGRWW